VFMRSILYVNLLHSEKTHQRVVTKAMHDFGYPDADP